MNTALAVTVLVAVLALAVTRPRGWPEAVWAVPGALLVLVTGLVPWHQGLAELRALAPTVGFLASILLLAHLAERHGVFGYAGDVAARWSRGSPRRLLVAVFAIASIVTATLSLDATVVLLTPVVLTTVAAMGARPRPHVYACTHLANSASLLLPVSNLTNLLAFRATGLTFLEFTALMFAPWAVVIAIEYAVLRTFFADELGAPARRVVPDGRAHPPRFALGVLAATLVGFGVAAPLGLAPTWVALAGAVPLALRLRPTLGAGRLIRAANPAFCAFVLALGVVVLAVRDSGFGTFVANLVPVQSGPLQLWWLAVLAALLANLLNNLPATLMLIPFVAHSPGLVLAVLIGTNVGPNLTYVGSLATLLWRQILHARHHPPAIGQFLRLGAITVPACLTGGVAALWLSLRLSGAS